MQGCWVFGAVERLEPNSDNPFQEESFGGDKCRLGNMFAVVVENRKKATLHKLIKKFIRPGSIITSDCFSVYRRQHDGSSLIEEIFDGDMQLYTHYTVNHDEGFKDPKTGAHTNTCEGAWYSQYKKFIPDQAKNKNALQGHLFERMWKRKYRHSLWNNMWRVLSETEYHYSNDATKNKTRLK